MRTNRRQHTVPRFYLKRFADGKSAIWQFDKQADECRHSSVGHVAVHRDFYPKERLSEFEDRYAPSVDKLIECKSYYALGESDRYNVRLFVSHMGVRTKQARDDIVHRERQLAEHSRTYALPDLPRAQNLLIRDVDALKGMNFTVVENKTGVPFVTSDNPVANFFIEAHLPLTPQLSLALLHRDVFKKAERVELRYESHVRYQNFVQLCNAGRFAYSRSKFRPSREALSAARNWRKDSRYVENDIYDACFVKPSLPRTERYEFELSDPENALRLRAIQAETVFGRWPQDYMVLHILSAIPPGLKLAGQMPARLPGWGSADIDGASETGRLARCGAALWNLVTRFA